MKKYVIFDTETTGLIKSSLIPIGRQPKVIEFCAILLELDNSGNGEIIDQITFLCNPKEKISDKITKITGIKNEVLESEKPFNFYYKCVFEMFKKADVRIAHNLQFDEKIVNFEFQRLGNNFYDSFRDQKRICTVEHTKHLKSKRQKLSELYYNLFGETFNAHRANDDVKALVRVSKELIKIGII